MTHAFHPLIQSWFNDRFGAPTEPQRQGWPHIAADEHTLIAAPTGSGKTLAAFLVCIDRLWRDWLEGQLAEGIQVVYVSPLKALSNDIERNLQVPLAEICERAVQAGHESPPIRTALRTGDTPQSARSRMLKKPPHILVTTPESLYLLLTSPKSRDLLRSVRTVIVDEIHALARDKRGSHLALSLERLAALCDEPPTRIGLSATQRPIDRIARFLVGGESEPVHIVDTGHVRELDLAIDVPPSELSAVCSHEQWDEAYDRLVELIKTHRSTLIFVNTRRLAERVSHRLREMFSEEDDEGEAVVAAHHGSLSRTIRLDAEQRLKSGRLKAIVATASLEMGIDIGYIDLVCQIGSPRSIATLLQRVGRSGHSLGATPKGRLFPLTRDELLEGMALVRAVRRGSLDSIEIPEAPLDILAQQIVAAVACDEWDERELLALVRRAWPYRELSDADYESVLAILSDGLTPTTRRGAYLHRDRINGKLRARKSARLAAITSGGAIPETAEYRVIAQPDETFVGTVDEDFAVESMAGDVFLLGNTSWRVQYVRGGEVVVRDAQGAAPSIPFWFGEGPGRTIELSDEVSALREEIAGRLRNEDGLRIADCGLRIEEEPIRNPKSQIRNSLSLWNECGVDDWAAEQATAYVHAQAAAVGMVPTQREILFERFFDESGGMQLVIHAPLGARINRAWGLALRKRFCRGFDFELQASATDNGIVLSTGPQHSFAIETLFKMLGPHNAEHLLRQAVLAAPMFQVRWRWNVTRALAVLRTQAGKKVPPYLQRFRSDDLLAATFPETVGCLENHHGDVDIPDHPLVRQTMHDCLTEAMDVVRWVALLEDVRAGRVKFVACDTREPSPFSHELLNANPYAFLDDAPLEERRTRAVATRRTFTPEDVRDLARLDPAAIEQVCQETWPVVRSADELHDALATMVVVRPSECGAWSEWFAELGDRGRAAMVGIRGEAVGRIGNPSYKFWIAAESWPLVRAVYPNATSEPTVELPARLETQVERSAAIVELLRGQMGVRGPVTAKRLAEELDLEVESVLAALEALEGQGVVLRGHFTTPKPIEKYESGDAPQEWCDRRLLARIHRLTLEGLRRSIQPVTPEEFIAFLVRQHRLTPDQQWGGQNGVREAIAQLQGFDMPAGVWEEAILARRVDRYDEAWLDQLFLSGEVAWGRLRPVRRDDREKQNRSAMTRMVPISLMLRTDLPWLVGGSAGVPPATESPRMSSYADQALEALREHGALFAQELAAVTGLLPSHLEEALRELAAWGLVTSDAFAAIRQLVRPPRVQRRRRGRATSAGSAPSQTGRWAKFAAHLGEPPSREAQVESWSRQLLARYGVLFRDLLVRESAAPPWRELAPVLRRMELRGQVRGGRFVSGVAGEQFAEDSAVEQLRAARDAKDDSWIVLSAADPLNLTGIVTPGPRIAATHKNALILMGGRCVAAKEANHVEFFAEFDTPTTAAMRRALQTGRREPAEHIRQRWVDKAAAPSVVRKTTPSLPSQAMRHI